MSGAILRHLNETARLCNEALDLHPADAIKYAEAALRGFESFGERAATDIEETRRLIAEIGGQ